MVLLIPTKFKNFWDTWDIRCVILLSLGFQILLILFSPLRKRSAKRIVSFLIWTAYLLADWVAAYAVGQITSAIASRPDNLDLSEKILSNKHKQQTQSDELLAFWAPFLLLHLGGPEVITAFSMEDNELWLRHLLGLFIQLISVAFVLSQTLPDDLLIPTVLLFVAGGLKFGERTRALYGACLANFKTSTLQEPDAGPNYAQLMEEYSSMKEAGVPANIEIANEPERERRAPEVDQQGPSQSTFALKDEIEVVEEGHRFYEIFKGLVVDLMFSFHERNQSRDFFFKRTAKDAFKVIEVELNFLYDVLYTKMGVAHKSFGYSLRFICSACIVASLERFVAYDQRPLSHKRYDLHEFDRMVTYILLGGAIGLDLLGLLKLIFSDWTIVFLKKYDKDSKSIIRRIRECIATFAKISKIIFYQNSSRWSESISQHSLIECCLQKRYKWIEKIAERIGADEILHEWRFRKTEPFGGGLRNFIFKELTRKAWRANDSKAAKEIYSGRGDWALTETSCPSLIGNVEVEYDESLLRWHVATELCFQKSKCDVETENSHKRKFCELLSHCVSSLYKCFRCLTNSSDIERQNNVKEFTTEELREFSKLLSDYMLYLLVMQPTMMSAVAGIGQIRYQDTRAEAEKFFLRGQSPLKWSIKSAFEVLAKKFFSIIKQARHLIMPAGKQERDQRKYDIKSACEELLSVNTEVNPMDVKGDRSKSVLFDACILAKELLKMSDGRRWEVMSKVWVELLSYAASHCRANTHAQQISKGGELVTFVWLLMAHFGLGEQFRVEAGHARAKLIVKKDEGPEAPK